MHRSGHARLELGDTSKQLIGKLGAAMPVQQGVLPMSDRILIRTRRAAISGNRLRFKLAAKQREI